MKKFEEPIVEIVEFDKDDVITTSGEYIFDENETPWD